MNKIISIAIFILTFSFVSAAQVTVSPDNITAYSQGATSAYLTFSNVVDLEPADATWCGEIISAAPQIGFRCDPATVFGVLPSRYNQSRLNGMRYTDIMSITPAVARRAYTDAANGNDSRFFYVKHFIGTNGNPDQFIPVTIRLSGNGAGVPFSLTTVKLNWQDGEKVVPFIKPNEKLPKITAEIRYTGTGRLKGRWEIVKPGEELPDSRDLLSESALTPEERGTQRRYTLLSRFSINLPPGGKYVLPGPENWRIDKTIEGMYILLFRVEASDAPNSSSNIGGNSIPTGAVAGFPMPTLRYYVGNSSSTEIKPITKTNFELQTENQLLPIILRWNPSENAKFYRVEIADETNKKVFSAVVLPTIRQYQMPSFIRQLALSKQLKWRVLAIDESKNESEIKSPSNVN
ncbi:MAG TPA: hypothetical protein PKY59_00505 [Pyrinomonadaceae bacterium]|nr:hypothetical protein [Pyrinomonadaceae bacterium]